MFWFGIDTCLKFCFLFAGRGNVCGDRSILMVCYCVLGKVEPFSFQCHVHLTGRPRCGFSRGSFSAYKVQVEMELG